MDDLQFRAELIHAIRVRGGKTRDGKKVFEFCCPRHEDGSPSAWVGENAWGCHACGFTESLDTLAEELGLARRSRGYTIEDYAVEKSFSVPKLMSWGVETFENEKGWCCVRIPYQDTHGDLLRNKFRGGADESGKHRTWWEGQNQPTYPYGLDRLSVHSGSVILVEGESDCHAAWHHDVLAVGAPGANTWKPEWAQYLKGRQVYIWQEKGDAGAKFADSVLRDISDAIVISGGDIDDLADLHKAKGVAFAETIERIKAEAEPKPIEELVDQQVREAIEYGRQDTSTAPKWGWKSLIDLCGPLLPGELWIVGARPGQGKSTFLLNFCNHLAEMQGKPWLFIGMEMDPKQLRRKWSAFRCDLNEEHVLTSAWERLPVDARQRIEDDLREQATALRNLAYFAPARRINLVSLQQWVEFAVERKCKVVVIDHLHQMDYGGRDQRQEMAHAIKEAKELAVEHQIVVVAAAQLNRGPRDPLEPYRIPVLSALKECGAIEEAADVVLMLSRKLKSKLSKGEASQIRDALVEIDGFVDKGAMRVTCRKHRRNGALATDRSETLQLDNGIIRDRTGRQEP